MLLCERYRWLDLEFIIRKKEKKNTTTTTRVKSVMKKKACIRSTAQHIAVGNGLKDAIVRYDRNIAASVQHTRSKTLSFSACVI